jgi:hypothetical protein
LTVILLIIVIAVAWTGVALVAMGLCAVAARGDRRLRGAAAQAAVHGESAGRLRLIA